MSEKRIRVSLEDNVSAGMQRIGDNSAKSLEKVVGSYEQIDEVIDGLIKDSTKYNLSIQDRIKWIEKEIQIQGRNAKIDFSERKQKLDHEKRLGEEKKRWSKQDEEQYRKKKKNLDEERKDETLYQDKLKARFDDKKSNIVESETKRLQESSKNKKDEDSKNPVREAGSRIGGIGRTIGNAALSAAGFGAVLSIGGFVGKMIDEGKSLDEARSRQTGATGKQITGGYAYGLKESALMDYATSVAKASGSAVSGSKNAKDQLAIEKGFGLDIGSMTGMNKVMRASDQTLVDATLDMLSIMKKSDLYNIKRGDFTQMGELLEKQNALNEMQASQREEVDARNSSMLMAGFGKVGGSFSDFRQGQTMSSMNAAITNPDNDFKQAFLLRTLRKQNPNASFLDLKMKQEEGIFGKGTLGGVMGELSKTFSGDQLVSSTSKMLGLSLHQAKRLVDYNQQNPNALGSMQFGSEEEFKKFVGGQGFNRKSARQRGAAHTGTIERWQSQFDTWMGHNGDDAVKYVEKLEGAYKKGGFGGVMKQLGSDIVDAIKEGFTEAMHSVQDNIKEALGMKSELSEEEQKVASDNLYEAAYNEDVQTALSKVPKDQLQKYSALQKFVSGSGNEEFEENYYNVTHDKGQSKQLNDQLLEVMSKFMPERYATKNGKLEVVVASEHPKQSVNNAYKPTTDN